MKKIILNLFNTSCNIDYNNVEINSVEDYKKTSKTLGNTFVLSVAFFLFCIGSVSGQCGPFQIYESFGTQALPTQGGSWVGTSMTYGTTSRTGLYGLTFNAAGDAIRTPLIANPGVLSFWYRRSSTSSGTPRFVVETSPDNSTWTQRGSTITSFSTTYQNATFDLGALSLTNVYIRIRDNRASGTAERYIDDLSITSTVAASNTILIQGQSCTPTLTAGVTYTIYDCGGVNDQYSASQTSAPMVLTPPAGYGASINFTSLGTESCCDRLLLYNGNSTSAPALHTGLGFAGTTAPGSFTASNASYSFTVDFTSDGSINGSGFVGTLSFELLPSCSALPTALTSSTITTTSATISWTAPATAPAGGYEYYVSTSATAPTAGTTPTGTTVAGVTTANLTGLTANTTYYFWVRSNCGGGDSSSWVSGGSFYTGYCTYNTTYNDATGITSVLFNSIANTSTGNATYSDFTSQSTSVSQGASYNLSVNVNTAGAWTVNAKEWIDWNQNLQFEASEEYLLGSAYNTTNGVTSLSPLTISVPLSATLGNTRMRIVAAELSDAVPLACGTQFYGEAEDYTISVMIPADPITITPSTTTTICNENSVDLTASSSASYTYSWSPATGLNTTTGATVTANPSTTTTYTVSGDNGAGMVTSQNITITITPSPSDVTISNSSETVCKNSVQTLVASGGNVSGVSTTVSSGNVNLAIPDFNMSTGVSQVLSVNTIPENATITNIDVTFNITHPWDSDVIINLEAPNGKIVNLVAKEGGSGDNFTNTIITSNTSVSSIVGNSAPFTGTFQAELASNTNASSPTPAINTQLFSDLFSIPNGDWKLRVYDDYSGDIGTLINCAITITYDSSQITWSPISDLYTDAACTVAYTGEHATTLYAKPSETRTYTASSIVGSCEKTDTITFTIASAVHDGTAWSSTPSANKELIFNGDFSSTENLEGCSCTVNSGNVVINSNHSVKLLNEISVYGGSITFENNSSLIQINEATNTGNITYKRTSSQQVLNTDYVYWSSPVSGQTVPNGYNYVWNNALSTSGNWAAAAGQSMSAGKGVIMRGIASRNFTGVPYNGEIIVNVYRRNLAGYNDNWNLVGNPYPSAISADEFLTENDNISIDGSIAIWTHNSPISNSNSNPFYGNYTYNYNPNDYIIYNLTGSQNGPESYHGFIPAGQAFFVKYDNDDNASPIAASSTIKFKNAMRTDVDGNSYNNSQFYRNNTSTQTLEKNRIWIDIIGGTSAFARTVVGYVQSATDNKDRLFDSSTSVTTNKTSIYSLINSDKMSIQAKGLPFNDTDSIALGYNAAQAGNFTIAIYAVDGLFVNQEVYLFDSELNIIHDIKTAPYTFTTLPGENNSRFSLVFNNETLSNPDYSIENSVLIINSNKLKVVSNLEEIESITVFDLLGRTIYNNSDINSKEFLLPIIQEQVPLIVKIKLSSGTIVQRKTFY